MGQEYTRLTPEDEGTLNSRGGKDQERALDEVIEHSIPAYGIICRAVDPTSDPREIKDFNTEKLLKLEVKRKNGVAFAYHRNMVPVLEVLYSYRDLVVNDLSDHSALGSDVPDRAWGWGHGYKRDSKVRKYVLQRAEGRCEYCGKHGFLTPGGSRFLEAHHIISLSKKGPDRVDNVAALCPEHHREAHFGVDAEKLEAKLLEIISQKES